MCFVSATASKQSSDGKVWKCRYTVGSVSYQVERSIRKGSWFEGCNLTLEEIVKCFIHVGHLSYLTLNI